MLVHFWHCVKRRFFGRHLNDATNVQMVSQRQIVPFSLQSDILLTRIQVHSNHQRYALSEQADINQKTPFDVIQ